jgi:heparin binding hemagglutinin HbhA
MTTTETNEPTTKIPAPLYAAAGAGDLAMERLRKLPERITVLQERVNAFQEELPSRFTVIQDRVTQKVAEIPSIVAEFRQRVVDTDTDKLRESARRNVGVVRTNAQAAQDKAAAIYAELVTRGEQVVGRNTSPASPARTERIVAEVVTAEEVAPGLVEVDDTVLVADVTTEPVKRAPKARKNN